jgi:hypothetical protein
MRGRGGGVWSCGVSANENSCAHHATWSPNKLWRSNSIFNLWRSHPQFAKSLWRRFRTLSGYCNYKIIFSGCLGRTVWGCLYPPLSCRPCRLSTVPCPPCTPTSPPPPSTATPLLTAPCRRSRRRPRPRPPLCAAPPTCRGEWAPPPPPPHSSRPRHIIHSSRKTVLV